jgi:hypothetical protein
MSRFVEALDSEIEALESALQADPRYMKLREAKRLRDVYVGIDATPAAYTKSPEATKRFAGKSLETINAVKVFLASELRPVPTMKIVEHLEILGIKYGGETPQNTVSSILSKSPDFTSNGRSGWTLTRKEKADDTIPTVESSSALFQPSGPVKPEAGGGT